MKTKLPQRQAEIIILISMVSDIVIRPIYTSGKVLAAQSTVPAIILLGIATIILFSPLWSCNKYKLFKKNTSGRKVYAAMYCLLFLYSSANTLVRTEQFYRFISDQGLANVFFVMLVLLVTIYACTLGIDTIGRVSSIVLWLIALSFLIIIFFNGKEMRLENLVYKPNPVNNIKDSFLQSISFTPEILLFFIISDGSEAENRNSFTFIIFTVSTVFVLFTVFAELVLANTAVLLSQPAQTLARLGGVSVFKRLDSVHIAIWILSACIKLWTFFIAYFELSLIFTSNKKLRISAGILLVAALTTALYALPGQINIAIASIATVVVAVVTIIYSVFKRGVYEKAD